MRNHTQISDILLECASCHCPTVFCLGVQRERVHTRANLESHDWQIHQSKHTGNVFCSVVLCSIVLCCAPLCCVPLCSVVLCYAVVLCPLLCCATLLCCVRCCVVLCCVVLCSIVLSSVVLCSIVLSRKKFISDLHMNIEGHFWGLPVASPMTSTPWKYFFLA